MYVNKSERSKNKNLDGSGFGVLYSLPELIRQHTQNETPVRHQGTLYSHNQPTDDKEQVKCLPAS